MKKRIAILLMTALCMGTFAGCGSNASSDVSDTTDSAEKTDTNVADTEESVCAGENSRLMSTEDCCRNWIP